MNPKYVVLVLIGWLCVNTGLSQEVSQLVGRHGYADLILTNGNIVTMDDRSNLPSTPGHLHQAMAVKGKRIMALGSNSQMKGLAGPERKN